MTRIASRHSGRRTSPASRRSRLKSDIGVHYCISRFTMQEQILQLSSTVKLGGATSALPTTPTRNRTKRQTQTIRKQHNNSWCIAPESLRISPLNFHTHFSSIFALKKVGGVSLSSGIVAVAVLPSEKSSSETIPDESGSSAESENAAKVAAP